jgi:hypothetical protein
MRYFADGIRVVKGFAYLPVSIDGELVWLKPIQKIQQHQLVGEDGYSWRTVYCKHIDQEVLSEEMTYTYLLLKSLE